MTRIRFEDLPSTNTPRNAENLNKLNNVVISPTEPTTGEEVWIQKGKNLLNPKVIFSDTRYYSVNEDLSVNVIAFDGSNLSGKGGVKLPAGTYTLSCYDRNGAYLQVYNLTLDEPILDRQQDVNVFSLTKESIVVIKVYHEDLSVFPFTIHIMLEQGEVATSYEAYIDKKIYTKNDNDVYEKFYDETNLEIYSKEEQRIGTWFGKPLYRKVFPFTLSRNTLEVALGNTNYDEIWLDENSHLMPNNQSSNVKSISLNYVTTDNITRCNIQYTNAWIAYISCDNNDYLNGRGYVIIKYTKTND